MVTGYDRLELLQYLQRTAQRMRDIARNNPGALKPDLSRLAEELGREADGLEKELIKGGDLPQAANER
jgi:hypothetical protein